MDKEMAAEELAALQKARDTRDLVNRFTHHPPKDSQPGRYAAIREQAREFALYIQGECPSSRELSLAITHLEETVYWAIASIARHE